MNRLLVTSFLVLALMIGATGAAPVAHAGQTDTTDGCPIGQIADSNGLMGPNGEIACVASADLATQNAAAQSAAAGTATDYKANSSNTAFNPVMSAIAGLFAMLVGVASLTLDYSVYYTVVNMGEYISKLTAIGVTWRILRDIGNIMLIFGFLAIGISVILNTERIGYGKKMLPMLLVSAVFLNFSLFFTEAVIDTGNLFATQFYTQINGGVTPTADTLKGITTSNTGISAKLMNQLGLQTLYDVRTNSALLKGDTPWYIGFLAILLFIVTAFVMFSLAFILVARFIVLVFLIILAPVGFAGLAVPQLANKAGQWWSALFQQTITAPVLLLLLYVALAVITDAQFLTGLGGGSAGAITGFVDNNNLAAFASYMMSFSIAIGLMLAVTISAKSLSAYGAGKATKLAGGLTGALSFGAISLAGRGTFGSAGYLLNHKRVQARAAGGGLLGFAAKTAAFTGRNLEKRNFDMRNIPGTSAGLGALGVNVGKGATVNAKTAIDKTREGVKYVKPFSGDWWRNQKKEYESAKSEIDRNKTLSAATALPGPAATAAQKELKSMSVDELASLKDIRGGIDRLVHNLSPEKFNELIKSDKLIPGEKTKLKDSWNKQFVNTPANPTAAATTIGRFNTEEIVALGGSTLAQPSVVAALGPNEFDAVRRKGNLSITDRRAIRTQMNVAGRADPAYAAEIVDYFDPAKDAGGGRDKYWNV